MHDAFQVMDPDPIRRVDLALEDLRAGRMVILVDDEDRENEGDLVLAAEMCTPEHINFMVRHARGLVCLSLTGEQVDRLGLPMMATNNQSPYNTAFTVSIEAREGVTTGISAEDRARTVQVAIQPDATPRDIVTPGHMFPLRARSGGVLERVGQTEGSVDLARLAGLIPAGVICEIMRDDGSMARMPDLLDFGREHGIRVCAVADLIKWRMRNERIVRGVAEGELVVPGVGAFRSRLYRGMRQEHHLALWLGDPSRPGALVRVQASPPSWAFLDPRHNRLAGQALASLRRVAEEGHGAVVLMHQGGGGMESIEVAYQRDFTGADPNLTRAAAEALRDLGAGCQILIDLGVEELRLITSSRRPVVGLEAYGLRIADLVDLHVA
jgi:3,4-dihydroxy 2-butanone 4-phosphate synthase/GTP cyclohydrolase II